MDGKCTKSLRVDGLRVEALRLEGLWVAPLPSLRGATRRSNPDRQDRAITRFVSSGLPRDLRSLAVTGLGVASVRDEGIRELEKTIPSIHFALDESAEGVFGKFLL